MTIEKTDGNSVSLPVPTTIPPDSKFCAVWYSIAAATCAMQSQLGFSEDERYQLLDEMFRHILEVSTRIYKSRKKN